MEDPKQLLPFHVKEKQKNIPRTKNQSEGREARSIKGGISPSLIDSLITRLIMHLIIFLITEAESPSPPRVSKVKHHRLLPQTP